MSFVLNSYTLVSTLLYDRQWISVWNIKYVCSASMAMHSALKRQLWIALL